MFERFSIAARGAINLAGEEARALNHPHVEPAHLLLGLIREDKGSAATVLAGAGISLETARERVRELVGESEQDPPPHLPFSPGAKRVLEFTLREALALGNSFIDTEHILLGLLRVDVEVLTDLGVDLDELRARTLESLAGDLGDS